ncbi:MAG: type II toxin-antitoxin system antitoxin SocA domain-containing protein [Pseudomonadota bacterium]
MSYSWASIANGFIEMGLRNKRPVDPMKIQKLCYFANGYYLAARKGEESLISESFQAWKFGPVLPSLYHAVKENGGGSITDYIYVYDSDLMQTIPAPPPEDDRLYNRIRDKVWDYYSQKPSTQLSRITHKPGGAWERTWHEFGGAPNAQIPSEYIFEEFQPLVTPKDD